MLCTAVLADAADFVMGVANLELVSKGSNSVSTYRRAPHQEMLISYREVDEVRKPISPHLVNWFGFLHYHPPCQKSDLVAFILAALH